MVAVAVREDGVGLCERTTLIHKNNFGNFQFGLMNWAIGGRYHMEKFSQQDGSPYRYGIIAACDHLDQTLRRSDTE